MTKPRLIDFNINEDLNKKFLNVINKLDPRLIKILDRNDLMNLEKFRSLFLSDAGNFHFRHITGVGTKRKKNLIKLFRKTLPKNPDYKLERKIYNKEFEKLSIYAKNALELKGIDQFEAFYYVHFIQKQPVFFNKYQMFVTRAELKKFIKTRCKSIKSNLKNSTNQASPFP
jgi:hypothetical protein